ncbi:hypothetical protein QWZ10_04100 [Paracoccus cavernae]|uniref:Uncharacterized protein n=1 Tax=Paracoccus cavernae TaxID=1571207 RepID=A0ABT8D326_9RHOB|nr:hypothetical protein [Paracoccus cavernae]
MTSETTISETTTARDAQIDALMQGRSIFMSIAAPRCIRAN